MGQVGSVAVGDLWVGVAGVHYQYKSVLPTPVGEVIIFTAYLVYRGLPQTVPCNGVLRTGGCSLPVGGP